MGETRKIAAILVADVVGYSRLAGSHPVARLRGLRSDLIDPAIDAHHGRIVKRTGDGSIIEFRSVVDAVRCAIEVQNGMIERNSGLPPERRIEFRVGIHLGDVVEESDGDLMGDGVNVAARLEGIAKPGAICLSEQAYWQVKSRLDLKVSDLGATQLKNIAEPVRVYSLEVGQPARVKSVSAPASEKSAAPRLSIAVLPFANMSGDPEQEYFADGISEDIITALSKLPQLFVIARNSSFTFKGRHVLVMEVARSLGVGHLLEGSVRKSGSRVRITAQLIDASTGGHVWAERFDRDLTDIFAVQDDVTAKIVSALSLNLSAGDLRRIAADRTDNIEAYDCYLRGRALWQRSAKEPNAQARALLERAVELDPKFASAHALLSVVHNFDYINEWSNSPSESRESSRASALRALSLDDALPIAHVAMASAYLWDRHHDDALSEANRALALDPNYPGVPVVLGLALHYSGRSEEALGCFDRALALDPFYPDVYMHIQAQALYQLGRYSEAAALLKRRILRNPDTDSSRVLLAAAYGQMGQFESAREAWREALHVNPAYSLEHRRKVLPYKNPEDFELVVPPSRRGRRRARASGWRVRKPRQRQLPSKAVTADLRRGACETPWGCS
ncbi:MAG TPA: adenylate/guanylate cyclase domain-containing protein [Roseiarcus sp.]|jgi:adenylate cyclase|nr:adenylate/guanylate cyclase domain-containing protein [Roseiarcus sp.]